MNDTDPASIPPTLVTIATFKRPELLRQLLESLQPITGGSHRIVVVDNDAARSAEAVVIDFPTIEYLHEGRPGIVAARNRGLDALRDETLLAFVDDDEWVAADWLPQLYSTMKMYSADVVVGPVLPVFPDDAPAWAVDGEYYERKRQLTGSSLRDAPTNNTLVKTASLRRLEPPRFNEAFSVTGGSDTELFTRIKESGGLIVWCDEAVAWERVPSSRLTKDWVRQRQRRLGNVRGRIASLRHSKIYVGLLGVGYIGYSVARLGVIGIGKRRLDTFAHMRLWRGVGIIESLRGKFVQEYVRDKT